MCAIAGIIGLHYNESVIQSMLQSMHRRGPDAKGVAMSAGICLLHTRLGIIDLEGGKQPMRLLWEGINYTLVYNGELYNTEEIRKELLKLGHRFEGYSDTEVLLHAFAQWKEDCLYKLNGIYAFAVWERESGNLFFARDRMGVKPLFYKKHRGGLLFASEIKTILEYPGVERKLDQEGIGELLLLGPGKTPGSGIFQDIKELEPGCCGWYIEGKLLIRRYWELKDREHTENFEQTVEQVRYLVKDAITRQMVCDVEIGTFLSGGLDSSLISAICAEKRGKPLPSFSLDFSNNDQYFTAGKFQPDSDSRYINIMQQQLNTEHYLTVLTPESLMKALEISTKARDLPGMADVDFSLLLFCADIVKKVKVALSGECADEIFGGYPWFRDPQVLSAYGFPWALNTEKRARFLNKEIKLDAKDFVISRYEQTLSRTDILPGQSAQEKRIKQMVNLNYRWFMQTLLDRKDRMSMYNSLEVRVPFCDHRIAEYMYAVPWAYREYKGTEKGLLRYAMKGVLPNEILWRKKSPYPKTYDPLYYNLVREALNTVIQSKNAPILNLVNKQELELLLSEEYTQPWYGQLMMAPQTIAYMLQLNYWLKEYKVEIV